MSRTAWCSTVILTLLVGGCTHPDAGIPREKALSILHDFGFEDIDISPSPDGWSGTADFGPNTYTVPVKVDRKGLLNVSG